MTKNGIKCCCLLLLVADVLSIIEVVLKKRLFSGKVWQNSHVTIWKQFLIGLLGI